MLVADARARGVAAVVAGTVDTDRAVNVALLAGPALGTNVAPRAIPALEAAANIWAGANAAVTSLAADGYAAMWRLPLLCTIARVGADASAAAKIGVAVEDIDALKFRAVAARPA